MEKLEELKGKIEKIVIDTLNVFEEEGYELVDIEMNYPVKVLRVFVDKPGGITIDDCVKISKELSTRLDVEDLIETRYTLEVSSPGEKRRKYDKKRSC
jgi:ribosome maturation factor RimP|uniref:Ribosome maturation factor RimP N-terminal domain-containing protein n=1 Tax=candidate division WOR-3 bacterium TaxID=2052148 RepID=A0A7C4YRG5_UNCW3